MALSKLGIESIAPENLRTVGHRFKLSLAVEKNSKPIEDFSESDSWAELESGLNAYADRLELHKQQDLFWQYLIMSLYLASTIAMVAFSTASRKSQSTGAQQDADDQSATVESSKVQ